MKNWLLMLLMLLSCSIIDAEMPERVGTLSAKITLTKKNGYFVLSDQSCWKVIGFSKRWRSFYEWWDNIQLVPENYDCTLDDWALASQIKIYKINNTLEVSAENASNQAALKSCTHILINTETDLVLFAIALEPSEAISQSCNEAYNLGYDQGYTNGMNSRPLPVR